GEQIVQAETAGADHLGKRLRKCTVGPTLDGCDRTRRRVEGDQHARIGLHQRKAARKRGSARCEGVLTCGIDYKELYGPGGAGERPREVENTDCFDRNVLVAANAGVDRNDVVLAFELQAIAREVDERHRLRTRRRYFVEELTNRPAQRVLVKVP